MLGKLGASMYVKLAALYQFFRGAVAYSTEFEQSERSDARVFGHLLLNGFLRQYGLQFPHGFTRQVINIYSGEWQW